MKNYILISIILFTTYCFAQSPIGWGIDENNRVPVGLKIGTKAPDFNSSDVNGKKVSLQELTQNGNVVLLFFRGQWCPVCNRYLSNFQDSVQQILDKGASVIAVTPETSDNAKTMISKTGMTFTVVPDIDEKIMKSYDVLFDVIDEYQNKIINNLNSNIAENNSKEKARLPVPATYIINKNGVIVSVFFDYNYKKRASVGEIVAVLEK